MNRYSAQKVRFVRDGKASVVSAHPDVVLRVAKTLAEDPAVSEITISGTAVCGRCSWKWSR